MIGKVILATIAGLAGFAIALAVGCSLLTALAFYSVLGTLVLAVTEMITTDL